MKRIVFVLILQLACSFFVFAQEAEVRVLLKEDEAKEQEVNQVYQYNDHRYSIILERDNPNGNGLVAVSVSLKKQNDSGGVLVLVTEQVSETALKKERSPKIRFDKSMPGDRGKRFLQPFSIKQMNDGFYGNSPVILLDNDSAPLMLGKCYIPDGQSEDVSIHAYWADYRGFLFKKLYILQEIPVKLHVEFKMKEDSAYAELVEEASTLTKNIADTSFVNCSHVKAHHPSLQEQKDSLLHQINALKAKIEKERDQRPYKEGKHYDKFNDLIASLSAIDVNAIRVNPCSVVIAECDCPPQYRKSLVAIYNRLDDMTQLLTNGSAKKSDVIQEARGLYTHSLHAKGDARRREPIKEFYQWINRQ